MIFLCYSTQYEAFLFERILLWTTLGGWMYVLETQSVRMGLILSLSYFRCEQCRTSECGKNSRPPLRRYNRCSLAQKVLNAPQYGKRTLS